MQSPNGVHFPMLPHQNSQFENSFQSILMEKQMCTFANHVYFWSSRLRETYQRFTDHHKLINDVSITFVVAESKGFNQMKYAYFHFRHDFVRTYLARVFWLIRCCDFPLLHYCVVVIQLMNTNFIVSNFYCVSSLLNHNHRLVKFNLHLILPPLMFS